MTEAFQQRSGCARLRPADCPVEWRSRYDGLVAIAYVDGKAVAGISGPWSDKFALTWWERPLPQRQLELFDSLQDAKHEVEAWAVRVRNGYSSAPTDVHAAAPNLLPMLVPVAKSGLLDQIRALLPEFARRRTGASSRETIERMRERHAHQDIDLSGLHFAADE
ncbi:hypothetical protein [Dokdonella soli]|uniref:Uncharacterized protein n=1 Tax=Dokdonella soli TaxID=529810 RepID=A0ABP3TS83_9GAMM